MEIGTYNPNPGFEYLEKVAGEFDLMVQDKRFDGTGSLCYELWVAPKGQTGGNAVLVGVHHIAVDDCLAGNTPNRSDEIQALFQAAKNQLEG